VATVVMPAPSKGKMQPIVNRVDPHRQFGVSTVGSAGKERVRGEKGAHFGKTDVSGLNKVARLTSSVGGGERETTKGRRGKSL